MSTKKAWMNSDMKASSSRSRSRSRSRSHSKISRHRGRSRSRSRSRRRKSRSTSRGRRYRRSRSRSRSRSRGRNRRRRSRTRSRDRGRRSRSRSRDRGRGDNTRAGRQRQLENLPKLEENSVHRGVVRSIQRFGAFVKLDGFTHLGDGLVHISNIARRRVEQVEDVVSRGDKVWVKVISIDNIGARQKIGLNMKDVDQSTGADLDPDNSSKYSKGGHRRKEEVCKWSCIC